MNTLLLIDIQNDFHDHGSLAIPGATEDATRIVSFIQQNQNTIHRIVATLDTHSKLHIAHPCFWINNNTNEHPKPFTIISSQDIQNGIWKPRPDMHFVSHMIDISIMKLPNNNTIIDESTGTIDMTKYCIEYTRRLEEGDVSTGRPVQKLCIWPEHCIIGSKGHGVVDNVLQALQDWTECTGRTVEYIWKGQNLYTEMYSALVADVPISIDTCYNTSLHESLVHSSTNKLIVAGQALSHCVNYTVRDIVDQWPTSQMNHIYILQDCTSHVPGFESVAEQFISDMKAKNVQVVKSTDIIL